VYEIFGSFFAEPLIYLPGNNLLLYTVFPDTYCEDFSCNKLILNDNKAVLITPENPFN